MCLFQNSLLAVIAGLIWFQLPYKEESIVDRYSLVSEWLFFLLTYQLAISSFTLNCAFSSLILKPSYMYLLLTTFEVGAVSNKPSFTYTPLIYMYEWSAKRVGDKSQRENEDRNLQYGQRRRDYQGLGVYILCVSRVWKPISIHSEWLMGVKSKTSQFQLNRCKLLAEF